MTLGSRRTSYQQLGLAVLGLTTFALGVPAAWAQIAVSANDNKIVNVDGTNQIVENPRPDTATIIDHHTACVAQTAAQRGIQPAPLTREDLQAAVNHGRQLSLRSLHNQGFLEELPAFLRNKQP